MAASIRARWLGRARLRAAVPGPARADAARSAFEAGESVMSHIRMHAAEPRFTEVAGAAKS
jgi:hypothetical protein